MPAPRPTLDLAAARAIVADHGFGPHAGPGGRVGIELEWITVDLERPHRPADHGVVGVAATAAAACLPGESRLSFEPGGQVELSSTPRPGLDAIDVIAADTRILAEHLARVGVGLVAMGLDPLGDRPRVVHSPRYDAMEAYFDSHNGAGRTMMRDTASIQVNVGFGDDEGAVGTQWRRAHLLGPVLAAAFANSPFEHGRPTGLRSTRLAVWSRIDPARTAPVAPAADPGTAWAEYALNAPVMLVRGSDTEHRAVIPPVSFGTWVARGFPDGWPTDADLRYHLTTLFPPVRPRGWLELRMLDALPAPWWRVAGAVTATLLTDPDAGRRAEAATEAVRGRWADAARHGLGHPDFAAAAVEYFAAARDALSMTDAAATLDALDAFVDRYVARGRTPADDRLDSWQRTGALLLPRDVDSAAHPVGIDAVPR